MTDQVIYSMVRVGKIHPPNKQVLRDISLGFFYGAKIGVLGLNGAGKSTLLQDHGRRRRGLPRRDDAEQRLHARPAGAGAAARCEPRR